MATQIDGQLKLYFTRVVRATSPTPPDEDLWLVPDRMLAYDGEVGESNAVFRVGGRGAVRLRPSAVEAADLAARHLQAALGLEGRAQLHDVALEVYEAAAQLRLGQTGSLETALSELVESISSRLGRSFIVAGLAGVEVPYSAQRLGSSMIIGHLSNECVADLEALSLREVGSEVRISPYIDAWWTEDWIATTEDSSLGTEIEERQRFHVPVIGIVVDAIGSTATYRAIDAMEAILGGVWVLEPRDGWRTWPPTPLGAPTIAKDPRSPDYIGESGDGLLPIEMLYVDSRGSRRPVGVQWRSHNVDFDAASRTDSNRLLNRVADAHRDSSTGRTSRRLAAACRFLLQGARTNDPGWALLHATIALEALVGDNEPRSGATGRFIGRLAHLLPGIERERLKDLYAVRSEVVHQGYTDKSFEYAADRASESIDFGCAAVLAANRLVDVHDLDRESKYLEWIS
jgi:hypothetical protein